MEIKPRLNCEDNININRDAGIKVRFINLKKILSSKNILS